MLGKINLQLGFSLSSIIVFFGTFCISNISVKFLTYWNNYFFQLAKEFAAKKKLLQAFAERELSFKPSFPFDAPSLFEWSEVEVSLPQTHSVIF